jgi:DNA-binding MarR family transcriptional regulator
MKLNSPTTSFPASSFNDAENLWRLLTRLSLLLDNRRRQQARSRRLSVTQHRILSCLGETDGLSLKLLTTELGLAKSSVSRAVSSLLKKGYLDRVAADGDRRSIALTITEAGRGLYWVMARESAEEYRRLLERSDPDVTAATVRLLARLVRMVSQTPVGSDSVDASGR